jgi:UDP-2,3-diacylglucosamine pyrophosphatase LpxH
MENGTQVYYITGNHDEFLRRFEKIKIGNLQIINQLTLNLNGEKIWIFHGDIFDKVIHRTKWLAKIGAAMYGFLTIINIVLNFILNKFGNSNILLFKLLKDKFRKKNDNLTNYEKTITLFALLKGVNTVICGHTHNPADLMINIEGIKLHYLNCGDWVENNTAVEYHHGKWKLKYYRNEILVENQPDNDLTLINKKELYTILLDQFTTLN